MSWWCWEGRKRRMRRFEEDAQGGCKVARCRSLLFVDLDFAVVTLVLFFRFLFPMVSFVVSFLASRSWLLYSYAQFRLLVPV